MIKLFFILYYSYCFGYAILLVWKNQKNGFIKALIITLLPVLGIVLALYLFKPKNSTQTFQEETEGHEGKDKIADPSQMIQTVDIENEINFVPIQDALLFNDNKTKRQLLIHSLKENYIQNPKILKQALKNEDSETSHYAATAIMEMKRKLQNAIQDYSAKLTENPDDLITMSAYAKAIKEYLRSDFLDEGTYQRYQALLSSLLGRILESSKDSKQQTFIDKINCDLELMNYDKATNFSEKFLQEYPDDEMAYVMAMKLHYTLQNPTELRLLSSELKKQSVNLSAKGLDIIRFWD